jgi:hypothetical protein
MLKNVFRNRHSGLPGFVVTCLFVTLAPSLVAQTAGAGALTGRVTDASGGVVANATVTATSVDSGQTQSATTGRDGAYKIGRLPPGNYRLKFEAVGFQTLEIPSVTVNGAETAGLLARGMLHVCGNR